MISRPSALRDFTVDRRVWQSERNGTFQLESQKEG
jgi:hypothetical protein